jgi:hypothetical protein
LRSPLLRLLQFACHLALVGTVNVLPIRLDLVGAIDVQMKDMRRTPAVHKQNTLIQNKAYCSTNIERLKVGDNRVLQRRK